MLHSAMPAAIRMLATIQRLNTSEISARSRCNARRWISYERCKPAHRNQDSKPRMRKACCRVGSRSENQTIGADVAAIKKLAERVGFEPTIRCYPYDDLANRCLQPLGHLSARAHAYKTHAEASNRCCKASDFAKSGDAARIPNTVRAAEHSRPSSVAVWRCFPPGRGVTPPREAIPPQPQPGRPDRDWP